MIEIQEAVNEIIIRLLNEGKTPRFLWFNDARLMFEFYNKSMGICTTGEGDIYKFPAGYALIGVDVDRGDPISVDTIE
jgi:hypothetical protein